MNRIDYCASRCQDKKTGELLTAACRAALTGGSILKELYDKPHEITMKGSINLVTEADIASETVIMASLEEDAPGISILAEESGKKEQGMERDLLWVVDPLDGTNNYAHGVPFFCTSIALLENGKPKVGAVYHPLLDELFCAAEGSGAWLNGKRINVTDTPVLVQALVATGFPYDIHKRLSEILNQIGTILPKVRDIRRAGAAALDLAYVACGRFDCFYEQDLEPWDTAAGWLLVQEAGGKISDFSGKPYSCFHNEILASNAPLHPKFLKLLV